MHKNKDKFLKFLESIDSESDKTLIEAIKAGFMTMVESDGTEDVVPQAPKLIRITYERWDEAAVDAGDTDDRGWVDEEGISMTPDELDVEDGITAVSKAVKFLKDNGANEFSGNYFSPWFSTEGQTDYRTGEIENRSYHLSGFSDEEIRQIVELMKH